MANDSQPAPKPPRLSTDVQFRVHDAEGIVEITGRSSPLMLKPDSVVLPIIAIETLYVSLVQLRLAKAGVQIPGPGVPS